jgi:hypothetical protein
MSAQKKSTGALKRSALSLAVGMVLASGAHAQAVSGSIFGQADPGDVVVIENPDTGFKREIAVSSDGSFRASQTPAGTYVVSVRKKDGSVFKTENVVVNVGTGTPVNFAGMTELAAIEVIGNRVNPIDVSSIESTTVLTSEQIDSIAVPRTITNVALLAPGTVKGDNRFGNLASIGGASVAENAYFVNGFNVTNIVTGTAFNQVPFQAIAEQQVKTGGYGAEFGRSLGGVVNIVTKRGTNEWQFGGNVIFEPKSLNKTGRTWYDPERDGTYTIKTSEETERTTYNVEAGGPIIKDTLFIYGLFQGQDEKYTQFAEGGSTKYEQSSPQWLVKVDWNINDKNLLELTYWQDEKTTDGVFFNRPADELLEWGGGDPIGTSKTVRGGENYIGRWTGYLTDSFTLSAMYANGKYSRGTSDSNSENCPITIDARTTAVVPPLGVQGCWVSTFKGNPNAGDERTAYRLDAEWAIGDHTLRAGYDYEEFDTVDANVYTGDGYWRYINTSPGTSPGTSGGIVPPGVTELARFRYFENGGTFKTENTGWYVEDTWNVTDSFLIYAGIRNEGFTNFNSGGKPFVDVSNTWAPRLGFSWDVTGDSTKKLFANAGRYYIPVYSNTNVRLAGAETFYEEFYTFSAIDPDTGVPTTTGQIGVRTYTSEGELPDPRTVVDAGLTPMYQDELILGYQQALNETWTAGIRAIYRDLKAGMDDICNYDEPYAWAVANGYTDDEAGAIADAINHCFLTNPGTTLKAYVDFGGDDLELVTIPAEGLGFPKAKREYKAIELLLEGTWDKAFMQASYTWSQSKGNTEGYVKSDNGQDDAGITQDFDYPGLMDGAYGYLPNDRRHTFKVFGSYSFTDEWSVGGNLLAQSGRPRNCFGVYPADGPDASAPRYGVASFYCGTNVDPAYPNTLVPRGTAGRVPWVFLADAQVVYTPMWAEGLSVRVAINNIFDSKDYYRQNDLYEDVGREPTYYYGNPQGFVTPRNISFQVGYQF